MRRPSIVMVPASVVLGVLVWSMGARSESSLVGTVCAHASLEGYEDGPVGAQFRPVKSVLNSVLDVGVGRQLPLNRIRRRRVRATGVCFESVVSMCEADVEDVREQPMG
ncbi:hypothetical protein OF83DRAFT_307913 [Amylostereum chailletii]|nr:hypothetical protein OF83DRAFT_307913 [Amylostereum chailletii]